MNTKEQDGAILREELLDEWRRQEILMLGKNPDVVFPECEKIVGEQLELF